MEELDIKQIWKQTNSENAFEYSQEAIEQVVAQKPQNIIFRFVKTLQLEKWSNLIVLTGLFAFLIYESKWYFGTIVLLVDIVFFWYYSVLIKKLDRKFINENVSEYLNNVYHSIQRFILHYRIAAIFAFIFGLAIGISLNGDKAMDLFMSNASLLNLLILLVSMIAGLGLVFYFIHLLYARKAKVIKSMIDTLDRSED